MLEKITSQKERQRQKQVLLVAFHYPPSEAIGAQRPRGAVNHLPEFGWTPTVLAPADPRRAPSDEVIETGYEDVAEKWKRRLFLNPEKSVHSQWKLSQSRTPQGTHLHTKVLQFARSLLVYPDETKGWLKYANRALRELRATHRFDVILSTAHPISCHLIAAEAKRIFGCPWIADFRDLWVHNSNSATPAILRGFEERLERTTLVSADSLVTVSTQLADRLRERYPGRKIEVISNGFEPDDFESIMRPSVGPFSVVHTGQLYEGRRDPSLLLQVVAEMLRKGVLDSSLVRISFYGHAEPWLVQRVRELQLEGVVDICGPVSRREALKAQVGAQMLVLLNWNGADSAGVLTGKVYEYLGARRPILLLGGDRGALTDLLEKTRAGVHLNKAERLEKFLMTAYGQYRMNGEVQYTGVDHEIAKFTHREMARQFAGLLDSVAQLPNHETAIHEPKLQAS